MFPEEYYFICFSASHLCFYVFMFFAIEMLDSVELGETAHKKTGTTVPESIHSFSKFHCFYTDTGIILRSENLVMIQVQLHEMGQIQFLVSINEKYNYLGSQLKKKKKKGDKNVLVSGFVCSENGICGIWEWCRCNSSTNAFIVQMKS